MGINTVAGDAPGAAGRGQQELNFETEDPNMSSGRIVQIIGAVIDVEFPREAVPQVYDALKVTERDLTLEVQQQLGDGVVRAIAMGSSEGVSRGLAVENTGEPISVPVGIETLGRIMDVLGNPIDECGPIGEKERASIHRKAPTYEELAASEELLETGIKVIDLVCPFANGADQQHRHRALRSLCICRCGGAYP